MLLVRAPSEVSPFFSCKMHGRLDVTLKIVSILAPALFLLECLWFNIWKKLV